MNTSTLYGLVEDFLNEAARLSQWGAIGQAATLAEAARRLEGRIDEWLSEPLTAQEAAAETGLKPDTISKKIASGELPNAGRKHRPRVRRRDLFGTGTVARSVDLPTPVEQLLDDIISNCE